MNLFQLGSFVLHSGSPSSWKIDCDVLSQKDWQALAIIAREFLPDYGPVEGVPRGGLLFADALRQYSTPDGPLLIVDDVASTGRSMEIQRAGREAIGCVVFARGNYPWWVLPLFRMPGTGV